MADKASLVLDNAKNGLQEFDDQHAITDKLESTGDTIAALAQKVSQRHDISSKAGIAAGLGTYKLLGSERDVFEILLDVEQRISAELSATVCTGYELITTPNEKKDFPQAVSDTVQRVGTASAATAITAYLFR